MSASTIEASTLPATEEWTGIEVHTEPDTPWVLLVWNDPVNLMSYVSYVFRSYFGYSEAKAQQLMMQVHQEGKSAVASGTKEKMEAHATAMHGFGLWATVSHDGANEGSNG
ncbi:MAG: ATP-dependent Clp protease adapter ClpS [Acidobacteria bacterium]|nr:ATP-dependent Clp protease adapter ClpS [Acidobacteriota bacterium]